MDEQAVRERYWIETLNCVNKNIPGRGKKEYIDAYNETNADKISEYQATYYKNNTEKICKYNAKYRDTNAKKIKEQKRIYNEKNINFIKCDCGSHIKNKNDIKRHLQSNKHKEYVEDFNKNNIAVVDENIDI